MPDARVNGIRLAYDLYGAEADPVALLVCGLGEPAVAWHLSTIPRLTGAGLRLLTYDHRGMPPSDCPPAPYSVADLTADAIGLLDHLGTGPVHVLGYSLGEWVAEELAIQRPDLVRSLALVGGANRTTAWERLRYRIARDVAAADLALPADADVVEALWYLPHKRLQDDATVAAWSALLRAAPRWENPGRLGQWEAALAWAEDDTDRADAWARIAAPSLVVGFEFDVDCPPDRAREAAEIIPGASYVQFADCGHLGLLERPDEVCAAIAKFFLSH